MALADSADCSVCFSKSSLSPECISLHVDSDGGYCSVSWLKNSSRFPPLICVEVYIEENNCLCIFGSLDSDFVERPVLADTLDNGGWMVCAKILVFVNSACWFFPGSSICLTVDTISSPITSFVPNWINSFESSKIKGFPSSQFVLTDYQYAFNLSWKAGESLWWLYFECSFPLRTVKSSNSEAALATCELQVCQRSIFVFIFSQT